MENLQNYVTKDVHDLHISRREAVMEKNLAKHESITNEIKSSFENFITEIRGDIKNINAHIDKIYIKIDDMKNEQDKALVKWGVIIAVIVVLGQVSAILLNL